MLHACVRLYTYPAFTVDEFSVFSSPFVACLFFSFFLRYVTQLQVAATAFKVNAAIECRLAQLTGEFELVCVEIEAYISEIDKPPSQGAPNSSECDDRDPLCPRRGRLLLAVASSVRSLHLQDVIVPK